MVILTKTVVMLIIGATAIGSLIYLKFSYNADDVSSDNSKTDGSSQKKPENKQDNSSNTPNSSTIQDSIEFFELLDNEDNEQDNLNNTPNSSTIFQDAIESHKLPENKDQNKDPSNPVDDNEDKDPVDDNEQDNSNNAGDSSTTFHDAIESHKLPENKDQNKDPSNPVDDNEDKDPVDDNEQDNSNNAGDSSTTFHDAIESHKLPENKDQNKDPSNPVDDNERGKKRPSKGPKSAPKKQRVSSDLEISTESYVFVSSFEDKNLPNPSASESTQHGGHEGKNESHKSSDSDENGGRQPLNGKKIVKKSRKYPKGYSEREEESKQPGKRMDLNNGPKIDDLPDGQSSSNSISGSGGEEKNNGVQPGKTNKDVGNPSPVNPPGLEPSILNDSEDQSKEINCNVIKYKSKAPRKSFKAITASMLYPLRAFIPFS